MELAKRAKLRQELEMALRVFQIGGRGRVRKRGWLRAVRQAAGISVKEVAGRLNITECEVYRMESAEKSSRIGMATLQQGARALGCELVYALVPKVGTLEDLAAEQQGLREEKRRAARAVRMRARSQRFGDVGGPEALRRALRQTLRNEGIRVRTKAKGWDRLKVKMPLDLELAYLVAGRDHS
jgi:predicted DNA-binding mobile mystery protein A